MVGVANEELVRGCQDEALRRIRLSAPFGAVLLLLGLAASPLIGVPLINGVLISNALSIAVYVAIAVLAWKGRLPRSALHATAVATWALLPFNTLTTIVLVGKSALVVPLIGALLAAPLVIVSRTGLVVATCSAAAIWWVVAPASDFDISRELARIAVVGSLFMANVAGFLSAHIVMQGAKLRAALQSTNKRLERELRQRRRTEDERETYRDQFIAAQRSEAIGSLAAGLAHEMNNILAGVLTSAELLVDDANDDDTARAAEAIAKEAQRGGALTQSLLAFARRGQYQRAPVRLDELVEEVERVLPRTLRRTISLESEYNSNAVVDVDRAQLIQAVLNLAINGADAMSKGGVLRLTTERETLAVEDAARLGLPAETYAVISVSDTGHGMDSSTRRRAFEPFYTTKPKGKGTGLGLAMVDGSVRAHGGSLEVQSVVGRGTTIRLLLPIHSGPAAEAAGKADRDDTLHGQVLVIDDEPLVRGALAQSLTRVGLQVVVARDGADGVSKFAASNGIILVICDMNMPALDGAGCIRAIQEIREAPVIIVSGYAAESEARELISEGLAHAFLEKPFTRRSLLDAVDAVLSDHAGESTAHGTLGPSSAPLG
ncbi:MAG: ATP-binding protein [Myxococcota bacterium]